MCHDSFICVVTRMCGDSFFVPCLIHMCHDYRETEKTSTQCACGQTRMGSTVTHSHVKSLIRAVTHIIRDAFICTLTAHTHTHADLQHSMRVAELEWDQPFSSGLSSNSFDWVMYICSSRESVRESEKTMEHACVRAGTRARERERESAREIA